MKVIETRNAHQALVHGIELLQQFGQERMTRNGPAVVAPWPVTTEYRRPTERLVFWPERDVNTAFLVYEGLWMLAGRRDLAPMIRYIKDFACYSDDGISLHGAYGYRWRRAGQSRMLDQLRLVAEMLTVNPGDRRAVVQMWDVDRDLASQSRDIPCNDMIAFQRDVKGRLDMTVFCRSNDLIWGQTFANAFHFGLLHEYMATWIGCDVGYYRQVSINLHAYSAPLAEVAALPGRTRGVFSVPTPLADPYVSGEVHPVLLFETRGADAIAAFDAEAATLLADADSGFANINVPRDYASPFLAAAQAVLWAHDVWRRRAAPERYDQAAALLAGASDGWVDLVVSMRQWIARRRAVWEQRMGIAAAAAEA